MISRQRTQVFDKVTTKCCEWLLVPEQMDQPSNTTLKERVLGSKVFRSFLVFSAFRAVYGAGILAVTYLLATSGEAPLWASVAFLLPSMVVSRVIFRAMKRKWPGLFS